ncbi:MAG: hypothetical protein Q4C91_07060 [Eubacteriales bacterium]|nr:hypothetical protein [Eubacteriales bacterium]
MNMTVRNIKFWGMLCLETLGLSIGASFVWLLFMGAGSSGVFTADSAGWAGILSLYPYYLLIVGALIVLVMGISYIQAYLPVVLSMNATRKSIAGGIFGCLSGMVIGILLISAAFWRLIPGDISASGWKLMPMFTGIFFIIAAVGLLLGIAAVRWGKVGIIVATIMCALAGAGVGMSVALSDKGLIEFVVSAADGDFRLLVVVGIALYLAVGAFAAKALQKLEVGA